MSNPHPEQGISAGVQHVIGSLDNWNDTELAVLKTAIALVEKRREQRKEREQPDAVDETNRICLARYCESMADFFADCEGVVLDRSA